MSSMLSGFFERPVALLLGSKKDGRPASRLVRHIRNLGLGVILVSGLALGSASASENIHTHAHANSGIEVAAGSVILSNAGAEKEYWDYIQEHISHNSHNTNTKRPLTKADRADIKNGLPYKPTSYVTKEIYLDFSLDRKETRVTSVQKIIRATGAKERNLFLNGEHIGNLSSIKINGKKLEKSEYRLNDKGLIILNPPAEFTLEIKNTISPAENDSLYGLYETGGFLSTHGEPFGFRRITYAQDRPDVQPIWKVRIEADKEDYPILLSNGNELEHGELKNGRHYAIYKDPMPKPSYLFAMVAGDLASVYDSYVTKSGRKIEIAVHAAPSRIMEFRQAIDSIKRAMAFDEEFYGRVYHLDNLHLVGVEDFSAGAMENTGLNIFKIGMLIGDKDTTTDYSLNQIDAVIAHEYFHNWSGDRVTIRDWAYTSLKEGITSFREQEFTAYTTSQLKKRVDTLLYVDYALEKERELGSKAVPMRGHNPKPSLSNYGMVSYVKTPEMLRMLEALLGEKDFRAGMQRFFDDNVGRAAIWEDFMIAMESETGRDLQQFRKWIVESHVPDISYETSYDKNTKELTLSLKQEMPSFAKDRTARDVPVKLGIIGADGNEIALQLKNGDRLKTEGVIDFTKAEQSFVFKNVTEGSEISIFRDHAVTAFIKEHELSLDSALHLARYDSDDYNRLTALESAHEIIYKGAVNGVQADIPPAYIRLIKDIINDKTADIALRKAAFDFTGVIPDRTEKAAFADFKEKFYTAIMPDIKNLYDELQPSYANEGYGKARMQRYLREAAFDVLTAKKDEAAVRLAFLYLNQADNMTDQLIALRALGHTNSREERQAFAFYKEKWKDKPKLAAYLNKLSPEGSTKTSTPAKPKP